MHSKLKGDITLSDTDQKILMRLLDGETYLAKIVSQRNSLTYTHAHKRLNILVKLGLVKSRKKGRINYLSLTKSGEKIAKPLEWIHNELSKIR